MEDSGSLIPCKFIIPIDLQSTSKIVKQHRLEAAPGEEKGKYSVDKKWYLLVREKMFM
jgi:hypothetical protein